MLVMSTLTYLMVMKSWISIIALKTVITEMCRCGLLTVRPMMFMTSVHDNAMNKRPRSFDHWWSWRLISMESLMKVVLLGPKAITFAKPPVTQSEKEKKNFRIPQKFQDPTALANRSNYTPPYHICLLCIQRSKLIVGFCEFDISVLS
jgi:hypothetical protein